MDRSAPRLFKGGGRGGRKRRRDAFSPQTKGMGGDSIFAPIVGRRAYGKGGGEVLTLHS